MKRIFIPIAFIVLIVTNILLSKGWYDELKQRSDLMSVIEGLEDTISQLDIQILNISDKNINLNQDQEDLKNASENPLAQTDNRFKDLDVLGICIWDKEDFNGELINDVNDTNAKNHEVITVDANTSSNILNTLSYVNDMPIWKGSKTGVIKTLSERILIKISTYGPSLKSKARMVII